jgi:hypothetical protein
MAAASVLRFDPSRRATTDVFGISWDKSVSRSAQKVSADVASLPRDVQQELLQQIARFVDLHHRNPESARDALGVGNDLLTSLGA